MASVDEKTLAGMIRAGELPSVTLLYGDEGFAVDALASRLMKKALGTADPSFNLQRFEGKGLSLEELANAIEALPVMAPRKCVAVKDLNPEELAAPQLEILLAIVADVPETTALLLYMPNTPLPAKKGKAAKLLAACTKAGTACECKRRTRAELLRFLMDRVSKAGASLSRPNAEVLLERVGDSLQELTLEADKLAAYANGGEITPPAIEALVPRRLEANAFALARAVVERNPARAFGIIDELFAQRAEGIAVLGALSMAFTDLYRAKAASTAGITPADMAADFNMKRREFAVKNAFRDAKGMSVAQLRTCIRLLADADTALKSSRAEPRTVIERAVAGMLQSGEAS